MADVAQQNPLSVDDFRSIMQRVRDQRRRLVTVVLDAFEIPVTGHLMNQVLRETSQLLQHTIERVNSCCIEQHNLRCSSSPSGPSFTLNIADEMDGLHKDVSFCQLLQSHGCPGFLKMYATWLRSISRTPSLAEFECEQQQLVHLFTRLCTQHQRPHFITDWDGTMKTYSSQYITCVQPAADAVVMLGSCLFARRLCHTSVVLTAGPLRAPGILDLIAMSDTRCVLFGGSWGREWQLPAVGRVVADEGISDEAKSTLDNFAQEMQTLLAGTGATGASDFSQFSMVGSGFQQKVDRVTLGTQSVCAQISSADRAEYLTAVRGVMQKVDPAGHHLRLHEDTREAEVCLSSSSDGAVWNKAHGVEYIYSRLHQSLSDRPVLICGDTHSDVPMLQCAQAHNPSSTYSVFVNVHDALQQHIQDIVPPERCVFVSAPAVIHAAMAHILAEKSGMQ